MQSCHVVVASRPSIGSDGENAVGTGSNTHLVPALGTHCD